MDQSALPSRTLLSGHWDDLQIASGESGSQDFYLGQCWVLISFLWLIPKGGCGPRTLGDCGSSLCFFGYLCLLLSGGHAGPDLAQGSLLSPTTLAPSFLQAPALQLTQQPLVLRVSVWFLCVLHSSSALPWVMLGWDGGTESTERKWWSLQLGCSSFGVECDVHCRARPGS